MLKKQVLLGIIEQLRHDEVIDDAQYYKLVQYVTDKYSDT